MPLTQPQRNDKLRSIDLAINNAGALGTDTNKIELLSSFLKLYPNFKEIYRKRAFIYFASKNWDSAINDYNIIIALDASADAYNGRGAAYGNKANEPFNRKEYDQVIELENKAMEDCKSALAINPNLQLVKDNLAISYTRRGAAYHNKANEPFNRKEYDQAIELENKAMEDYKSALALNPNLQLAKGNLATCFSGISLCYEKQNKIKESYEFIKKAQDVDCKAALRAEITNHLQSIEKLLSERKATGSSLQENTAAASSQAQASKKRTREEEQVEIEGSTDLPALESFSTFASTAGSGIIIKKEQTEASSAMETDELEIAQFSFDPAQALAFAAVKQEPTEAAAANSSNWQASISS